MHGLKLDGYAICVTSALIGPLDCPKVLSLSYFAPAH